MTAEIFDIIKALRAENYPYSFIARELDMSINTVKSACLRKGVKASGKRKTKDEKTNAPVCKCCHIPLKKGVRSDAKFCSSYCRTKWRRQNMRIIEKKTGHFSSSEVECLSKETTNHEDNQNIRKT